MMMPPLGCAAVPSPKKKLTSASIPAPTPTTAEVGVLVTTDAAAAGVRTTGDTGLTAATVGVVSDATALFLVSVLPSAAFVVVSFVIRAVPAPLFVAVADVLGGDTVVDDRGCWRPEPACAVDFEESPDDELLDVAELFEPAEPVASADATAGTEAIAAPTPSTTAEAPTQVSIRRWPGADCLGAAIPPNSAGSIRSPCDWESNRAVELIRRPQVAVTSMNGLPGSQPPDSRTGAYDQLTKASINCR
jgi:hypothetical protein